MGDDTPALEILERDVKAGHAATIGKVDEIMLFYLMSHSLKPLSLLFEDIEQTLFLSFSR